MPGKPPAPAVEEDRNPLPVDLPNFGHAIPGVASGIQPFPDGVDWLKSKGYRTILHLRLPGEDNTASKRMFEKKGFRFLSLEVSPARLTRELANEFSRFVTDPSNQPMFVYDKDGSLTGGLWYLYFRLHARASPEKALAEATRLGLKQDEEDHRTMWLALQKLLEKP